MQHRVESWNTFLTLRDFAVNFGTNERENQVEKVKIHRNYIFLLQSIVINKTLLNQLSPLSLYKLIKLSSKTSNQHHDIRS